MREREGDPGEGIIQKLKRNSGKELNNRSHQELDQQRKQTARSVSNRRRGSLHASSPSHLQLLALLPLVRVSLVDGFHVRGLVGDDDMI